MSHAGMARSTFKETEPNLQYVREAQSSDDILLTNSDPFAPQAPSPPLYHAVDDLSSAFGCRSELNTSTEDGVVRVMALNNQLAKASSKMHRGFQAFLRNTGAYHPTIKGKRPSGPPPVSFTVDFDTGSSDLFLPAQTCQVNCEGHIAYDTDASSTARNLNRTFSLSFGDGSTVHGNQFTDTVIIANLTATNQTVGAASRYSTGFAIDQFPPDGLMGMAFPQISNFPANPVFQTLIAEDKTTARQFAFKLTNSGSELFLGGADNSQFIGSLSINPVVQEGFWQVSLDAVNVNGAAAVVAQSAIIDTGTTLVLGNWNSVSAVYAAIPGSQAATSTIGPGFFTFPCDSDLSISLTFGGKAFAISPSTFNLGLAAPGSSDCVGGIAAIKENFWIVGDVFLQNVYTVFDVVNPLVAIDMASIVWPS
ncbi:putative peptidase A1 family protein [Lyophyllum shimeji]|uniref:Peptidase A1 family protein n=1 Tax=Lyophyllum shimeji TaxID=47721 RepID=A0A9P3Q2G6_LYOSH|nr:putative peptidase A1 family protein [Lyophyllum shimeji]